MKYGFFDLCICCLFVSYSIVCASSDSRGLGSIGWAVVIGLYLFTRYLMTEK